MLPQLSEHLLRIWDNLPLERRRPERLSYLGMRTDIADGYASWFAFADRDAAPLLLVQIPRHAAAAARLGHAWEMLQWLHRAAAQTVGRSLLRPVWWDAVADGHALVTTAPAGEPLTDSNGSAARRVTEMGDWLIQLAAATRSSHDKAQVRRDLEIEMARVAERFALTPTENAALERWIAIWDAGIAGSRVDLFAAHGNLCRRNVWCGDHQLTIINWERSRAAALPLHDLLFFALVYLFPPTRRAPLAHFVRALEMAYLESGSYAAVVRRTVMRYCAALGLPPGSVDAHLGLMLACQAEREYEELQAAANAGYLPLLPESASQPRRTYQAAIKDQVWINLLRAFIRARPPAARPIPSGIRVADTLPQQARREMGT